MINKKENTDLKKSAFMKMLHRSFNDFTGKNKELDKLVRSYTNLLIQFWAFKLTRPTLQSAWIRINEGFWIERSDDGQHVSFRIAKMVDFGIPIESIQTIWFMDNNYKGKKFENERAWRLFKNDE